MIETGSNFYSLTYVPERGAATNTDEFRRIEVEVKGQGYELAYRRGYYADRPAAALPDKAVSVPVKSDAVQKDSVFNRAMQRGMPDAMQIVFKARVLPTGRGLEAAAPANNRVDSKVKGPWRSYQVDIAADPRPIRWTKGNDGSYQGKVEFVAVVYDDQGRAVNLLSDTVTVNLTKGKMIDALRTGVGMTGHIGVPEKGTYWLRIGIRDVATNRAGTAELPVSAVKELAAVEAAR